MKVFSIIPYWFNKDTGETRVNKKWIYIKTANSYNELFEFAENHKEDFFFRADSVFKPNEINESNLKFDFSIKEISDIMVTDIFNNEYRVKLDIISRIEIKRIEVPINQDND